MKKIFITISIVFLALNTQIHPLFAQTISPTTGGSTISQQNRITNLKNRASAEIKRRVNRLTEISTILNGSTHLTSSQITSFQSSIQTEITSLNALGAKIAADADLTTLKTDVQSIVKEYRVYLLYIPQLNILRAADRILNLTTTITTANTGIIAKLQARITEAQNKGQNVTSLQTALTDLQNKVNDAVSQANNAISTVTPLTPAGYPGNQTTLMSARTMIKSAISDLQTARTDAKTIIQGLKSFKTTSASPTP